MERKRLGANLKQQSKGVSAKFKDPLLPCYCKRFLSTSEFKRIILNDQKEDIASWTMYARSAEKIRSLPAIDLSIVAIFKHTPLPNEILLNFSLLWNAMYFRNALSSFIAREQMRAMPLLNFANLKYEVILENVSLKRHEIIGFTSIYNSFDSLCDVLEIPESKRNSEFKNWKKKEIQPGIPAFNHKGGAQMVVEKLRQRMINK